VADMMFQLNNLWTLPLQILLALLLLHATVGPAGTLAGVATMVLMMWAQLLVAGQARECQKERTAWQDLRLKATTEALNNMKEREEAERENKEVGTWECLPAGEEVGHTTGDAMSPEGKEAVKTVRWSKRGIWEAEAMQPATQVLPGPAGMKGAENWVAWEGAKAVEYLDEEKTAAAEVIKLHAWEGRFLEQIKDYRAKEVACLHAEVPLSNLTPHTPFPPLLSPFPPCHPPQLINLHAWEGWFLEQIEDYRAEEAAWLNVEVIKLHAWEGRFLEQIEDYRAEEAAWLARYNYLMAANIVFLWMSPLLVASATFAACVAFEEPLSAASIFTAIATFRILQEPLRSFPDVLSSISQALVSLDRLARYQSAQEIEVTAVSWLSPEDTEDAVFVDGGTFTWDLPPPHLQHMHRPTLRGIGMQIVSLGKGGIGMQIGRGARVAICGPVGSGKSSLLSCILGEMHKLSGIVQVAGTIAHVPQTPWIQNGTIRDVTFGLKMNLQATQKSPSHSLTPSLLHPLTPSLIQFLNPSLPPGLFPAVLPRGDETEIGERGINLSGGQKQRIQVARAVYHDADIYLLDDPFSSVDTATGSLIFDVSEFSQSSIISSHTVHYSVLQLSWFMIFDVSWFMIFDVSWFMIFDVSWFMIFDVSWFMIFDVSWFMIFDVSWFMIFDVSWFMIFDVSWFMIFDVSWFMIFDVSWFMIFDVSWFMIFDVSWFMIFDVSWFMIFDVSWFMIFDVSWFMIFDVSCSVPSMHAWGSSVCLDGTERVHCLHHQERSTASTTRSGPLPPPPGAVHCLHHQERSTASTTRSGPLPPPPGAVHCLHHQERSTASTTRSGPLPPPPGAVHCLHHQERSTASTTRSGPLPPPPGAVHCLHHQERSTASTTRSGPLPPPPGAVHCLHHQERSTASTTRSGPLPPPPGAVHCLHHQERSTASTTRSGPLPPPPGAVHCLHHQERSTASTTRSGPLPPPPGAVHCLHHQERSTASTTRNGPLPPPPGTVHCLHHQERVPVLECVLGLLGAKTVLFVTNQLEFLPAADLILVMRDGEIVQAGQYEELLRAGTGFSLLLDSCILPNPRPLPATSPNPHQVMRDGEIVQAGQYEELQRAGTDFSLLLDAHNNAMGSMDLPPSNPFQPSHTSHHHLQPQRAPSLGNILAANGDVFSRFDMDDQELATLLLGPQAGPDGLGLVSGGGSGGMGGPGMGAGDGLGGRASGVAADGSLVGVVGGAGGVVVGPMAAVAAAVASGAEDRQFGRVNAEVYRAYLTRAYGGSMVPIIVASQFGRVNAEVYRAYLTRAYGGSMVPIIVASQVGRSQGVLAGRRGEAAGVNSSGPTGVTGEQGAGQVLQMGANWWLAREVQPLHPAVLTWPDVRAYASLGIGSGPFVVLRAFPFAYAALSSPFIPPSLPSLPPPPPPSPNSPPLPPTYPSQVLFQVLQIGANWWLAREVQPLHPAVLTWPDVRAYASLAIGSGLFVVLRAFLSVHVGLRTADGFFQDMLHAVFHAPMAFFDSTPTGRTLARASADQNALDLQLFFNFGSVLNNLVQLLGIFLVTSAVTWPVIVVLIPLALLYVPLQRYYLSSSRELTRIDGLTKSPILAHFSETLAGAAVIRAFAQEERFEIENADAVDNNMRAYFHYYGAIYWLGLRLETISAVVLAFVAFLLVLVPQGTIEPGLAGVSLAYGLTLNMALVMTMWHLSNLENKLVAVDRIRHFSAIPSEAPLIVEGNRPSADWPNRGSISFENLQMRYREAMPLVLKGVTVTFRGGEKVGVVGRTGSGKSTLVVALFRLVEPVGGRVMIDGVDISTIGLQDLRSRLAIIPQDPTLFEGTVRSNLDPLGRYHSSLLWEVLEKCQLAEAVMDKEDKLDAIVVEGGENWSVGQRQLFCLARALLKRSRILVLDEATASVDSATDAIIQRTIKENFARATVITVAHRIPSVIDSDKVLVLEADCLYLSSPLFTHLSPLLSLCLSLSLLAYRFIALFPLRFHCLLEEAGGRGKGRRGRPKGSGERGTGGEGGGKGTVKGKQLRLLLEEVGGEGLVGEGGEEEIGADGSVGKRNPDLELRTVGEGSIQSDSNGSSNNAVSEVVVVKRTRGRRKTAELTEKKEEGEMEGAKGGENLVAEAREEGREADSRMQTESPDSVLPTTTGGGNDSMLSDSNQSEIDGSESLVKVVVVRRTRGRRKSAELTEKREEVGMEGGGEGEGKKKTGRGRRKSKEERVNDKEEKGDVEAGDDMRMGVRSDSAGAVCADVGEPMSVVGNLVCVDMRREGPSLDGGSNHDPPSVHGDTSLLTLEPPQKSPTVDGGDSLLKFLLNLALEAVGGSDTEGERGSHVPAPTALDPMELRKRAWHADISQRHPKGAVILGVDPDVLGAVAVLFVRPRRKQEVESCAVSVVNTRSGQEEQGDGVEKVLHVRSCFEATQNATASEWEERLTVAAAEAARECGGGGSGRGAVEEEGEGEEDCERVWEVEGEMEGWTRILPGADSANGLEEGRSTVYGQIHDVPYELVSVGASNRKRHCAQAIAALLHQLPPAPVRLAYVEQARPFPSDGKQGWYGCGFGFGVWMGVLAASGFEVTAVTSVRWKAAIRSQASLAFTSKEDSRQLALSLFPSLATQLKRKKDHGRAEALLIATYGTNLWPSSGEKSKKTRSRAKAATGEAVRTGGEGMEDGISRIESKEDSVPWGMRQQQDNHEWVDGGGQLSPLVEEFELIRNRGMRQHSPHFTSHCLTSSTLPSSALPSIYFPYIASPLLPSLLLPSPLLPSHCLPSSTLPSSALPSTSLTSPHLFYPPLLLPSPSSALPSTCLASPHHFKPPFFCPHL
ncbi:unnamed protein product, partial [Closterium sp. NIES-65]